MEEYEVELIDYLRVIWKGKWIILACLVAALTVTAALMWTRPNEYQGTIAYRLYQSLQVFGITSLGNQELLSTVMDFPDDFLDEDFTLKAEPREDRVQVTLSKATTPEALTNSFDRLTAWVKERLGLYVERQVAQVTFNTPIHIKQLTQQRDSLREQITELDSPDPEDPLFTYLAQKVVDLEALLVAEQVKFETLRETKVTDLFTLKTVGQLTITKAGPNRKMSLAIAGVLGLFLGVLLAFFIHYLMGVKEKEADGE